MAPLKCYSIFLNSADILHRLLESNHIWAIGTIHGRLPLDGFRHLGPCPRVGPEVKI